MVIQKGEKESSKGKTLWDPSLDVLTHLEKALLPNEGRERLMAYDETHLVREAIIQFGQALTTSFLATTKMKDQRATEDLKAQEIAEMRKEIERLQNELNHSTNL